MILKYLWLGCEHHRQSRLIVGCQRGATPAALWQSLHSTWLSVLWCHSWNIAVACRLRRPSIFAFADKALLDCFLGHLQTGSFFPFLIAHFHLSSSSIETFHFIDRGSADDGPQFESNSLFLSVKHNM